MRYTLKLYDTPLLIFSGENTCAQPKLSIDWVDETKRTLLPIGMKVTPEGLLRWIKRRIIPKYRAFALDLFAASSMSDNRPLGVIEFCSALSLNDAYWVVMDGDARTFDEANLYDTAFSVAVAQVAFTGMTKELQSLVHTSPEYTTNGCLRKCWRRVGGEILLYKGGSSGGENTGFEPYAEFYAAQVAEALGLQHVAYRLGMYKKRLCSVCGLFTDKRTSYVPAGTAVGEGGLKEVQQLCERVGPECAAAFKDMLVFDAVIANTDRHLGNFGFLVESATNTIRGMAPLFDHGLSMFCAAGPSRLVSEKTLGDYIDTLRPSLYGDFIQTARSVVSSSMRARLAQLETFRLKRHGRHNMPARHLRLIEKFVRRRAAAIAAV